MHDTIAAGEARAVEETEYEEIAFKASTLKKYQKPKCFRVGEHECSMEPIIRAGDVLLVDVKEGRFDETRNGRIFVVRIDGGLAVKRVEKQREQLLIISDNRNKQRYPTRVLRGKEAERAIVGAVIWIGRYLEGDE